MTTLEFKNVVKEIYFMQKRNPKAGLARISKRALANRKVSRFDATPYCNDIVNEEILKENLELMTPYVYQAMELNEKRI